MTQAIKAQVMDHVMGVWDACTTGYESQEDRDEIMGYMVDSMHEQIDGIVDMSAEDYDDHSADLTGWGATPTDAQWDIWRDIIIEAAGIWLDRI